MGERQNEPFQLCFNPALEVDFQGSRVTSDGGLILVRELDERLGLGDLIAEHLSDSRRSKNTQLPLADLFRQSVYSRVAGYEDVSDAERLSKDRAFRLMDRRTLAETRVPATAGARVVRALEGVNHARAQYPARFASEARLPQFGSRGDGSIKHIIYGSNWSEGAPWLSVLMLITFSV